MISLITLYLVGLGLILVQVVAALPWFVALNRDLLSTWFRQADGRVASPRVLQAVAIGFGLALLPAGLLGIFQDKDSLEWLGRLYGSILSVQLLADLIAFIFLVLVVLWPKGAAVGLAAFREGLRQPLFWLLAVVGVVLLGISPFLPYFTFGEDYVMVLELGFDLIMLLPLLLTVIVASMSISDEIEGRTAITLMSKPVSRRQFLLGKFVGILMVGLVLTGALAWWFNWTLLYKHYDLRMDPVQPPSWLASVLDRYAGSSEAADFLRGAGLWMNDMWQLSPGLVLGFTKMMVLLAIAVALATRIPMIVNLVTCLVIYFLGHLAPVLGQVAQRRLDAEGSGSAVGQLLKFTAQVFDTVLPPLDLFSLGPALSLEVSLTQTPYLIQIAKIFGSGFLYSSIALLLGLVLFEDRDLA
jgi:hypothetical protein